MNPWSAFYGSCAGDLPVAEFARAYKMDKQEAYRILKKCGGLDYVSNNWWALHIDNPYWVVREMLDVCRYNGFRK
ncbi:MAG: DUF3791 domain-containing protein [Tannerella sp.]|jgi:hypothetical protein|nr:DUF3791 domain-containing protein [Tannerella sp.]